MGVEGRGLADSVREQCGLTEAPQRVPRGFLPEQPYPVPVLQGVVGGVMIVTPNNIMFDPHKSDPLVIENGCEEYGLICPMEEVVSIALYNDISHMKIKDALPS